MDERLEAGRLHLRNGEEDLRRGQLVTARNHFETALLQFRGPELRLGEAHVLRGLASVELALGDLGTAAFGARRAIDTYRDVRDQLEAIDREGVSGELVADAITGEAAAHVVLAESLLRGGRSDEARTVLGNAQTLLVGRDDPSATAAHQAALGRLELRVGATRAARQAFDRAIDGLSAAGDVAGEAGMRLLRAEADRLDGALDTAADELGRAMALAERGGDAQLLGRCRSATASVAAQRGHLAEAEGLFTEALEGLAEAGDRTALAFALLGRGDVRSRRHDLNAVHDLADAVRMLARLEHRHGLGLAMLRLAEHLLRLSLPAYALATAEAARQHWVGIDPVRGVGQALRVQVRALATLKRWPEALTVAEARAAIAGAVQPHAWDVVAFYRERAPASLYEGIDGLDARQLELRAEQKVGALLDPLLKRLDLEQGSLGLPGGVLDLLQAVLRATPAPAPVRRAPAAGPPAPADATWEVLPPDDEAVPAAEDYVGFYDPPPMADLAPGEE